MNHTFFPKMTKSYLLESDHYLMMSSKSSSFALSSDENVFRVANAWNGNHHSSAIPSGVISDRQTVKSLVMQNVPSNVPPIAYINGNSVRPVRCRHYSQQQTLIHNNNYNNNNNRNSEKEANSGIKVTAGDMHNYAESNENGVNDYDRNDVVRDNGEKGSADKNSLSFASMAPKSITNYKVKVLSSASSQHEQQPQQSPLKQRAKSESPVRQSAASSIRDYVTNNESKWCLSLSLSFSLFVLSIESGHLVNNQLIYLIHRKSSSLEKTYCVFSLSLKWMLLFMQSSQISGGILKEC